MQRTITQRLISSTSSHPHAIISSVQKPTSNTLLLSSSNKNFSLTSSIISSTTTTTTTSLLSPTIINTQRFFGTDAASKKAKAREHLKLKEAREKRMREQEARKKLEQEALTPDEQQALEHFQAEGMSMEHPFIKTLEQSILAREKLQMEYEAQLKARQLRKKANIKPEQLSPEEQIIDQQLAAEEKIRQEYARHNMKRDAAYRKLMAVHRRATDAALAALPHDLRQAAEQIDDVPPQFLHIATYTVPPPRDDWLYPPIKNDVSLSAIGDKSADLKSASQAAHQRLQDAQQPLLEYTTQAFIEDAIAAKRKNKRKQREHDKMYQSAAWKSIQAGEAATQAAVKAAQEKLASKSSAGKQ